MGRTAFVECTCLNRRPVLVPGELWWPKDEAWPFTGRGPLTLDEAKLAREHELAWGPANLYECQHARGRVIETTASLTLLWSEIIEHAARRSGEASSLSSLRDKFPVLSRLAKVVEDQVIPPDEAYQILRELVQLRRLLVGRSKLPADQQAALLAEIDNRMAADETTSDRLAYLASPRRLAEASLATGNPIEIVW